MSLVCKNYCEAFEMREVLYVKRGRRYKAVSEYDSLAMDAMPEGSHLVVVTPGCKSTRFRVDPAQAPLLAAFYAHRETLLKVLMDASKSKLDTNRHPSAKERKAWKAWAEVMGEDATMCMTGPSAMDILEALEKSLIAHCQVSETTPGSTT
jgi:hypothetical protein